MVGVVLIYILIISDVPMAIIMVVVAMVKKGLHHLIIGAPQTIVIVPLPIEIMTATIITNTEEVHTTPPPIVKAHVLLPKINIDPNPKHIIPMMIYSVMMQAYSPINQTRARQHDNGINLVTVHDIIAMVLIPQADVMVKKIIILIMDWYQ